MKNYRYFVPVAMILCIVAAWYLTIHNALQQEKQYKEDLKKARNYLEENIWIDAMERYDSALSYKDTIDVRIEVLEAYFKFEGEDNALDYAQEIMSIYPREAKTYELIMQYYIENEKYEDAFALYDKAKTLGLAKGKLKELINSILYNYYILDQAYTNVSSYQGQVCAVEINGYWGYVNDRGQTLIGTQYPVGTAFFDDFGVVEKQNENKSYEWEMIDIEGNKRRSISNDTKIQSCGNYSCGVYPLFDGESYQYYTSEGKKVFEKFVYAGTFYEGYALVSDNEGYFVINNKGKAVTDKYKDIKRDALEISVRNELFWAKKDDTFSLYNLKGKKIGDVECEEVSPFLENGDMAAVKQDGKWGFVDKKGKMIIEPQYEDAHSFSNGFAAVKKEGKWGFINADNKVCIGCDFEDASDFNESGNVFINRDGMWSLLTLYLYNH